MWTALDFYRLGMGWEPYGYFSASHRGVVNVLKRGDRPWWKRP